MHPSGPNDLEILENLKEMIKNGQHEHYRAKPDPHALASIYLGDSRPAFQFKPNSDVRVLVFIK